MRAWLLVILAAAAGCASHATTMPGGGGNGGGGGAAGTGGGGGAAGGGGVLDGGAGGGGGDGGVVPPGDGGVVTPPIPDPPGSIFPSHFFFGIVALDTAELRTWLTGRPFWSRYEYLNNGFTNGWANITPTPGDYARTYIRNSKQLGLIPAFVYYQMPGDAGESFAIDLQHAGDSAYMKSYLQDYKLLLDIVNVETGPALIILEPDFWGYLQQNISDAATPPAPYPPGAGPTQIVARVGSTGLAYAQGFPDTVAGLGNCLLAMTRQFAPAARVGFEVSLWATNGHPQAGLVYDTVDNVRAAAQKVAAFHQALGAGKADFWVAEKNGLDAGGWAAQGAGRIWYWGDAEMANYLVFAKTMTQALQRPALGWQVPIGHTGLPNTVNQYEDTFAEYTFRVQNNSYVNVPKLIDAGFRGILFGGGVGISTTVLTDGGWFGDQAGAYGKAPVPIQ